MNHLRSLMLIAMVALLPETAVQADALPSSRLICSFNYDVMLARLQQEPLLVNVSKDQYGSPIVLRITHSLLPTAGGQAGGLLSAVLVGGTLGLLPAVTNQDLVVTYDLFVNDTLVANYEYRNNFTRVTSIYSKDSTGGLGEDGQKWALSTVAQFSTDLSGNPKIAALITEYKHYFAPAVTTTK